MVDTLLEIVYVFWRKEDNVSCQFTGGAKLEVGGNEGLMQEIPEDVMNIIAGFIPDPKTMANLIQANKDTKWAVYRTNIPRFNISIPEGMNVHIGYISGFNINALEKMSSSTNLKLKNFTFTRGNASLLHVRVSGTSDQKIKREWVQKIKGLILTQIVANKEFSIIANITESNEQNIESQANQSHQTNTINEPMVVTYIATTKCQETLKNDGSMALIEAIKSTALSDTAYTDKLRSLTFVPSEEAAGQLNVQQAGSSIQKRVFVRKEKIEGRNRNVYRIKGRGNQLFISKDGALVRLIKK